MYNSENQFVKLAFSLYTIINSIKTNVPYKVKSFGKFGLDALSSKDDATKDISSYNDIYEDTINQLRNTEETSWILMIKDYVYFIKTLEKVFFYFNDKDESKIYAHIDDMNNDYSLTLTSEDYILKWTFKDSSINVPGIEINIAPDDPLGFMKEESPKSQSTVLFIELDIIRTYGNKMKQHFNFIYNSSTTFKDDSDYILLDVVKNITTNMIIDHLNDILNNAIYKYSINNDTEWDRYSILHKFDFYKKDEKDRAHEDGLWLLG